MIYWPSCPSSMRMLRAKIINKENSDQPKRHRHWIYKTSFKMRFRIHSKPHHWGWIKSKKWKARKVIGKAD